MSEEKKRPSEGKGKRPFGLRNIFYHNTFVLVFSFCVTLVAWFFMAAASETDRPVTIYDVPIQPRLSASAEEEGLRIFNMSYTEADLEVSGSSLITGKLTSEDFDVSVTLDPASTKLTGNTLQKVAAKVRVAKKSSISDYSVSSINPNEVNIEYDRYKEASFTIENELKYSADSGYYAGMPIFSDEQVLLSGPESSVNKISRVAVNDTIDNALRAEMTTSCPIRLYDRNNQEITDISGLYLSMSVETVTATIPVMPKKTVSLVANTVRQPKGFGSSRIVVEPAQIEIAGPQEVLGAINEIQLETAIDFAELDISQKNQFTVDIPLPTGVRNLSGMGDNALNQATVSVNLNGYQEVRLLVPEENIQTTNPPAGKEVELTTKALEVTVIGSQAQVSKLTGDAILVQADLTNFAKGTGNITAPATVTISGSGADSCWVTGKYAVRVTIAERTAAAANVMETVSSDVAATPQE